jgi:hypothetical protein
MYRSRGFAALAVTVAVALGAVSARAADLSGLPSAPQLPQPQLPQVSVPSLPTPVPVPQLNAPSVPLSAPQAPALPALLGAPAGGFAGGAAGGGRSGGGGFGSSYGAASNAALGRGAPAGPGPGAAHASLSPAARRSRQLRRERRLGRAVEHLRGCFYALSRLQRRVLVLRGGLGDRPPMSRRAVAKRLDTTRLRVRRAEHRGLRRLRAAARSDRCTAHGGRSRTGPAVASAARPLLAALVREPGGASVFGATKADKPGQAVRSVRVSSRSGDHGRGQRSERSGLTPDPGGSSSSNAPLIVLLLSAGGALTLLLMSRRRSG